MKKLITFVLVLLFIEEIVECNMKTYGTCSGQQTDVFYPKPCPGCCTSNGRSLSGGCSSQCQKKCNLPKGGYCDSSGNCACFLK
ncbi:uncharacterized protein LOC113367919 [Ctenocephalides felis]|uniref:uncharacterized protein LOC113367919 n=1 Tax=Ctenocephalides felis TaxID=7515 RepID=UPI000E6E3D0C|nr:uncharacterized protein LOC113367919 [Ctenocephalides felis]